MSFCIAVYCKLKIKSSMLSYEVLENGRKIAAHIIVLNNTGK